MVPSASFCLEDKTETGRLLEGTPRKIKGRLKHTERQLWRNLQVLLRSGRSLGVRFKNAVCHTIHNVAWRDKIGIWIDEPNLMSSINCIFFVHKNHYFRSIRAIRPSRTCAHTVDHVDKKTKNDPRRSSCVCKWTIQAGKLNTTWFYDGALCR